MSSVYSQKTGYSSQSKNTINSQVSNYMNKAKGGGYSKLTQAKTEAQQREILEKLETEKQREKRIIMEKKQREKEKERRMAEERLRKINEENDLLQKKKDQQKEFYTRFLRQTAEQNLKKHEEKQIQNVQQVINNHDRMLAQNNNNRNIYQALNQNSSVNQIQQQQNSQLSQGNVQSKFQSKIPRPAFASQLPLPSRQFNINKPIDSEKEENFISKMNGLDLELSQTKRIFGFQNQSNEQKANNKANPRQIEQSPSIENKVRGLFDRGDLIDSLDLNIGYESIQKLKDGWGFGAAARPKNTLEESKADKFMKDSDLLQKQPKQIQSQTRATIQKQETEEVDLERDSDVEDLLEEEKQVLNDDEMKLLGERVGFAGGRKQEVSNKDWIESSIRQSVSEWKGMFKYNKENQDTLNQPEIINHKPTWIDQQYSKEVNLQKILANNDNKAEIQTQQQDEKIEEDEFTFGQKQKQQDRQLNQTNKNQPQQQQQNKPPVHQKTVRNPSAISRAPKFDDNKSMISKASRASSKSKSSIQHSTSSSIILSKEEELRLAKEKKEQMDKIKKQYSQVGKPKKKREGSQARGDSPTGATTKCTRDEDINIEEFMKDDLRAINREEDRIQRELLNIHKSNIHKHHQVVEKFQIDTKIKNTEELVRKLVNAPAQSQSNAENAYKNEQLLKNKNQLMRPGVSEKLEEQIEESLENLDNLLNNMKSKDPQKREAEILKIGKKYNIDFNLSAEAQENTQSNLIGYSKQVIQSYQQPFNYNDQRNNIGSEQINKGQYIMSNKQQHQSIQQNNQSAQINQISGGKLIEDDHHESININSHSMQKGYCQNNNGSQIVHPQNQGFQFQPFNNASIINNLYSQQQQLQENLNQLMYQQQQRQNLEGEKMGQYVNLTEKGLGSQKGFQQLSDIMRNEKVPMTTGQTVQQVFVRSNRDLIKMRQMVQRQEGPVSSQVEENDYNFDQYKYSEDQIEDSLNGNYNKQIKGQNLVKSVKNDHQINKCQMVAPVVQLQEYGIGDKVKINPKFNMKILFEDD
ncbi:UNKNOWN [Stylonychia lemnae]|uniref:Uncharacterized protein n=1 Tax=Stylonychia lemnae TaxID=5949 RepID=A0A078A321_STYLE|nr:UNKNOWN [Stylonychia lemnae]|eukprot:CDW76678.1 UNKNOWN [Stylonychia lemnae]